MKPPDGTRAAPAYKRDARQGVEIGSSGNGARDERIFALWLACWMDEKIENVVGCDKVIVSRTMNDLLQNGNLAEAQRIASQHLTDFDIPPYNIWKDKENSTNLQHFGGASAKIKEVIPSSLFSYRCAKISFPRLPFSRLIQDNRNYGSKTHSYRSDAHDS